MSTYVYQSLCTFVCICMYMYESITMLDSMCMMCPLKEMMENTLKAIRMNERSTRTMHDEQRELADIESVKIDHRRQLNMKKAALDSGRVELRGLEVEKDRMQQRNLDKVSARPWSVLCISAEAALLCFSRARRSCWKCTS